MINDVNAFRRNFSLKHRYFLQSVQTKTNCCAGLGVSITALTMSVDKPWKVHSDWWRHGCNHIRYFDFPQRESWKSACFLICMFTHVSIDVSLHLFPDFCYQPNVSALPQPWTLHTTCLTVGLTTARHTHRAVCFLLWQLLLWLTVKATTKTWILMTEKKSLFKLWPHDCQCYFVVLFMFIYLIL